MKEHQRQPGVSHCSFYSCSNANKQYSKIANGRVRTEELYIHRIQKLFFVHLSAGLFGKDVSPVFRITKQLICLTNICRHVQ